MIKNKIIFFFIFIFILQNKNCFSETEIFIKVKVDNEIITNHDILKESEYLKLINPELLQLKNTELLSISQNSLINQIIKAKEISKYLDLKKNHLLTDKVLKDLYKRLDFQNKEDFNKTLKQKNIYTIGEIKQKLKI